MENENNNVNDKDGKGGEVIQVNENNTPQIHTSNSLQFGEEIRKLILTAGTLDLPDEKNEILFAPVKDDEVYIKPDGLIYMTWTKFSGRLSKAVGTAWTMIPEGRPVISNNNLIIWGFHLMIKGAYCGFAIGEQQYHDNKRMTFGEACEGAKSNALTRLCKAMGIAKELWDKEFINEWLKKYSDRKWEEGNDGKNGRYKYFLKPNAFANLKNNVQVAPPLSTTPVTTAPVQTQNTTPAQNTAPPVVTPVVDAPVITSPMTEGIANSTLVKETKIIAAEKTVTPAVTISTPVTQKTTTGKTKPGYTGAKGKSKIAENTDFLNQKSETTPATEETKVTATTVKHTLESLDKELDAAKTTGQLQMIYNGKVKAAKEAFDITEEEKETLRKKANGLFVKLSSGK